MKRKDGVEKLIVIATKYIQLLNSKNDIVYLTK
jgi:hypothetical protein